MRTPAPLRFGSVLALIAGGAALTAGAAALTWASGSGIDELRGPLDVTATGSRAAPALVPVAAASVAALGALLAAKGGLRRAVGAVTMLLGVVVVWLGIRGLLHAPVEVLFASTSSVSQVDTDIRPLGPVTAALGGLALVAAGLAVLTGRIRARELGARYERPGSATSRAASSADPALEMWKELDDHRDPTLDPPAPTGPDKLERAPDDVSARGEPPL